MNESASPSAVGRVDLAIAGAGAAGLATAIFARRFNPLRSVVLLEGAPRPGAKILVSGGTRCNVTNRHVTERDFWGGSRPVIRRVLNAFTAAEAADLFTTLGVPLHEEADGKLFPDSGRARDVLDALLRAVEASGARLLSNHRVHDVTRTKDGFSIETSRGVIESRLVVLATGGQSLPKTGSDGAGFDYARRLGHSIVETTPALVPLVLDPDDPYGIHAAVSGVSHPAALTLRIDGRVAAELTGSLLWTHFGISGPVVLNISRHWLRATLQDRNVSMSLNFCPGVPFERLDAQWTAGTSERPRASIATALSDHVPGSVAAALLRRLDIDGSGVLAHMSRRDRHRLLNALLAWPLAVTGSRGYNYAEATAGGVTLTEVDPATLESRVCPGLYLVGEMLDVDGRIGGFNFQWAWSTGFVAGRAAALR